MATAAHAQHRAYQHDKYGSKEHSTGSYETDGSGRTYRVDKYGSREYSKGSYQTDKDGRTNCVDKYGAKLGGLDRQHGTGDGQQDVLSDTAQYQLSYPTSNTQSNHDQ